MPLVGVFVAQCARICRIEYLGVSILVFNNGHLL